MKYDLDEIKEACETSNSMAAAASLLRMNYKTFVRIAKAEGLWKPNQGGKGKHKEQPKWTTESILNGEHPGYQTFKLKRRLIAEGYKENKCERCGISEWYGEPISCELHHVDGNPSNYALENLKMLCPNCHAQTENFRAKNKRK